MFQLLPQHEDANRLTFRFRNHFGYLFVGLAVVLFATSFPAGIPGLSILALLSALFGLAMVLFRHELDISLTDRTYTLKRGFIRFERVTTGPLDDIQAIQVRRGMMSKPSEYDDSTPTYRTKTAFWSVELAIAGLGPVSIYVGQNRHKVQDYLTHYAQVLNIPAEDRTPNRAFS